MKTIGTAKIKDFDSLMDWAKNLTLQESIEFADKVMGLVDEMYPEFRHSNRSDTDSYFIKKTVKRMYRPFLWEGHDNDHEFNQREWAKTHQKGMDTLRQFSLFYEEYGQPLNVAIWNKTFAYMYFGNPEFGIVVPAPALFFNFEKTPSYDDVPVAQLKSGLDRSADIGPSVLPASMDGNVTKGSLKKLKTTHQNQLSALKEEMEQVQRGETAELVALKAEIKKLEEQMWEKKQALMVELEDKLGDMEEKVAQMEAQIWLLDSQIYAIRCFAGETVTFAHIRTGRNAPDTEPVIVYQKLRFLDEDLGRLASLYQLDWQNINMFEEFLRHSPEALETFAPDNRCVMLVRLSKTGRTLGRSSKHPYSNMLENYEYYHGRTVGIIIRNGENLYLGWTDEDRVHIKDDFIISRVNTTVTPAGNDSSNIFNDELHEKRRQREERKKQRDETMSVMDGVVSRAFVFNILQGVVKNTNWLPLPDGESLVKQSTYVRFSLADMCLEDHRFSNFDTLIEQANEDVAAGDMILAMQYLCPDREGKYKSYYNDRGRGEANRTHDCSVSDCVIYPVNLVEMDKPREMIEYAVPYTRPDGTKCISRGFIGADDKHKLSSDAEIVRQFTEIPRHIFVSVEKAESNYARANFEVYPSEFINLAFMNSVWLTWAINTKNLGNWRLKGHDIEYAHAIRYLKTALDHVRKREAEEKAEIDKIDPSICVNPDWPLMLSDWKFMLSRDKDKRSVHMITAFQAKRFVKWVADGMPERQDYGRMPIDEERDVVWEKNFDY